MSHNKIRHARTIAGLTQSQLASRLGVHQGTVAHWESGQRNPPVKTLHKIAQACNLSISFFIESIGNYRADVPGLANLQATDTELEMLAALAAHWPYAHHATHDQWLGLLLHIRAIEKK